MIARNCCTLASEGLHSYTLNKAHSTTEVVKNLGRA